MTTTLTIPEGGDAMSAAVRLLIVLPMLPILYLWLIHPRLPRRELSLSLIHI